MRYRPVKKKLNNVLNHAEKATRTLWKCLNKRQKNKNDYVKKRIRMRLSGALVRGSLLNERLNRLTLVHLKPFIQNDLAAT
jgi:hypothetical protein